MLTVHVIFLTLLLGTSAFFTALAMLNVRYAERTAAEKTDWLEEHITVEKPRKLLEYTRVNTAIAQLQTWTTIGFVLLVLYAGVFANIVDLVKSTGWPLAAQGTIFFVGVLLAFEILSLPFDIVETFVVEELFDFNQQTTRQFARDKIISLAVGTVLVAALSAVLFRAIAVLGSRWWFGAWLLFGTFTVLMQVVYPRVIAPLFNDFEPIESGDLYEAVYEVFDRTEFSASELYEMDASRRSSHVNAYFVGFGRTKRVVLFDTLIEQLSIPAIQSVLAHELAHYERNHIWKQLAASVTWVGIVLFLASLLLDAPWLYDMFGVAGKPAYAGLMLAALWLSPLAQLTSPLTNRLSLAHEREADAFAVDVMGPEPMISALESLASENLSNPFPHPLYELFQYDHPPIPERIRHIQEYVAEHLNPDRSS